MMKPESIFITGGGGMLAHALVDALSSRGRKAVSLSRAECDISDSAQLNRTFEKLQPTLVFNCAAHTKVDLCEQELEKADAINGHAVGELARLCKNRSARMVHVSTDFVFDGSLRRPYRTDDPVNPLSAYGKSKLLGETLLQKNATVDWLIVRTAWVYGRHGANFPRTMVQAARAGKPLSVIDDQVGAPTYTPHLAAAILDLLSSGATGIWHVTNSGQTTWHEFARATLAEFGVSAEISPIRSQEWRQRRPQSAIRPGYSVLELEPFSRQTGRSMPSWRDGLTEFRKAVQEHGF